MCGSLVNFGYVLTPVYIDKVHSDCKQEMLAAAINILYSTNQPAEGSGVMALASSLCIFLGKLRGSCGFNHPCILWGLDGRICFKRRLPMA